MAVAAILGMSGGPAWAAKMPIKRLLLLLEMARQREDGGEAYNQIPIARWTQVIKDLAS